MTKVGSYTYKSEKKSGEHLEKIWVDLKGEILQGALQITSQGAD